MFLLLLFTGCKDNTVQVSEQHVEVVEEVQFCDEDCMINNEIQEVIQLLREHGPVDLSDKTYEFLAGDKELNAIIAESVD